MARIVFYDGKFPFIDGVPSLISNELFENCCCPVPANCPCDTWFDVEWPCAGLVETYTVDWFQSYEVYSGGLNSDCDTALLGMEERRFKGGTQTLTAHPTISCTWTGTAQVEYREWTEEDGWSGWSDVGSPISISIQIFFNPNHWRFNGYSFSFDTRRKYTGATPVGSYVLYGGFPVGPNPWCSVTDTTTIS